MSSYKKERRRTKIEVMLDILESCEKKHKPTAIMYDARTSWVSANKYLSVLTEKGYLWMKDTRTRRTKTKRVEYYLTDKGTQFLKDTTNIKLELEELF